MSDDRCEEVIDAVMARVNTTPPVGIPTTKLEEEWDQNVADLPSCSLFPGKERVSKPEQLGPRPTIRARDMILSFEVRAAVGPGLSARRATAPIRRWLIQRLAGSDLGSRLAIAVEEDGVDWIYEGADLSYCLAVVQFTVTYIARVDDLSKQS